MNIDKEKKKRIQEQYRDKISQKQNKTKPSRPKKSHKEEIFLFILLFIALVVNGCLKGF
ncbi:hypothetical protein [Jeotgalibacillus sp. S-D1]|uniref:hypothetical protein n=1 Tax=Jeotgalibacillus sp. S-D1 TaxID=2552189 RepID=UPI001404C7AF|nr:hypothetical protein [Jeotgalibacillus sp. S-D1]